MESARKKTRKKTGSGGSKKADLRGCTGIRTKGGTVPTTRKRVKEAKTSRERADWKSKIYSGSQYQKRW